MKPRADFLVGRERGCTVTITVLVPRSQREDCDSLDVTVELDLHVGDLSQFVRVHTEAECPDHRTQGGGICNMCGGRGSSMEVPMVDIRGFKVVEGDLSPINDRLHVFLEISNKGSVPIGTLVADGRSSVQGFLREFAMHMGTWFNVAFDEAKGLIVFGQGRSDPTIAN